MPFHRAVPVLQSMDVAASIDWYECVLGFEGDAFPEKPPYSFAILRRESAELMLQFACKPAGDNNWAVYLRVEGGKLLDLIERVRQHTPILRGPERMFYGQVEIEVADPDGHHIVIAEYLPDANVPPAASD